MKLIACTITIILTIAATRSKAQAKDIFFELGGPGLASINYDMRFTKSEAGFGGRIGIGGFGIGSYSASTFFIPVGVNYLFGKDGNNFFEVGAGITPVVAAGLHNNTFDGTFGHLNFGYRLQPKKGGFLFRAAIVPVFGNGYIFPFYGGVSFGYKF